MVFCALCIRFICFGSTYVYAPHSIQRTPFNARSYIYKFLSSYFYYNKSWSLLFFTHSMSPCLRACNSVRLLHLAGCPFGLVLFIFLCCSLSAQRLYARPRLYCGCGARIYCYYCNICSIKKWCGELSIAFLIALCARDLLRKMLGNNSRYCSLIEGDYCNCVHTQVTACAWNK